MFISFQFYRLFTVNRNFQIVSSVMQLMLKSKNIQNRQQLEMAVHVQSQSNSYDESGVNQEGIQQKDTRQLQEHRILSSTILSDNWLIAWRIFAAMYCTAILIWSFADDVANFFLFLTNWVSLLTSFYFSLACVLMIQRKYEYRYEVILFVYIRDINACHI